MLWTPFNLGILLAPQPWDGWIYLQPESLLVTSYHQVFLQFFLPFSDSSQEGGFFLLKIVSLKNKCWFFSPDVCQKSRWGWLQKRVKRLPVVRWHVMAQLTGFFWWGRSQGEVFFLTQCFGVFSTRFEGIWSDQIFDVFSSHWFIGNMDEPGTFHEGSIIS